MKNSIFLLFVVVSSCTTSSLYKEIDRQVEEVNFQNNDVIKWKRNYAKKVFRLLQSKLKYSTRIIYIYTWVYAGMTLSDGGNVYMALVYDVNSKESYSIYLKNKKRNRIIIQPKDVDFKFEFFLLKNYLDGKIDYLKSLQNNDKEWIDHVLASYHYILDVKKDRKMKYLVLEPISLDQNGKPL